MAFRGAKYKQRYKHRTLATEGSSSEDHAVSPVKKKRGRPKGSKSQSSIQRASMATINEQEEQSAINTETTTAILDMPRFDEAPKGKKRGRKRKNKGGDDAEDGSGSCAAKQQKGSGEVDASEDDKHESPETSTSPAKKSRGRPKLKPKAGPGRPRKEKASQETKKKSVEREANPEPLSGEAGTTPAASGGENYLSANAEPQPSTSREIQPSASGETQPSTSDKTQPSTNSETQPLTNAEPQSANPASAEGEDPDVQLPTVPAPRPKRARGKGLQAKEGKKRSGDAAEDEGVEGSSKTLKKAGGGKGAKLKIAPLQVAMSWKGKKKN